MPDHLYYSREKMEQYAKKQEIERNDGFLFDECLGVVYNKNRVVNPFEQANGLQFHRGLQKLFYLNSAGMWEKMEYNKVQVTICGKNFALQTQESAGYMKELAKILDSKIRDFMSKNQGIDLTTASILIGLSVLDDSFKTNSDIDNIRAQITSYAAETAEAKEEIDRLNEKIQLLEREKESLQRDLELHALREKL